MKTTKQTIRQYLSIVVVVLISIIMSNCQAEEEQTQEQDTATTLIYKEQITAFLGTLKLGGDKSQNAKIDALLQVLESASISTVDLKSTEKLIIVNTSSLKGLETNNAVRLIFVQYQNKIFKSNIVTFNNTVAPTNYDALLQAIFDRKANKLNYTGTIKFHNPYQVGFLELNYQQGELLWQGAIRNKTMPKANQKSSGCTDWYWVTTWSDGHQTSRYLYTTCDGGGWECQAYRMSGTQCGGGGGGGDDTSTSVPQYPSNPTDTELFTYIDHKGRIITERYNAKTKSWDFFSTSLSEVVVYNNYEEYYFLIIQWPKNQQKVVKDGIVYTYDAGSASWGGEIEGDFEDKIDDSELDDCTKEIMDKINQDTNNDIVKILEKFGTSEYNVKLQMGPTALNNYAETKVISKNNYSITVSNNSFSDATKLYRATGLLHEMVHAYMLSIVDDYKIYPTNAPFNGFPELFKLYVQKTGSGNTLAAQHEDMANKYVNAIASALEKYHLGNTSGPVSLADKQVFADLAWSGLDGTEIFNKKYPKGSEERKRITNRLVAETIGIYSSNAIGKPCN
ncbi:MULTISPECIES: hypothetical protein [unclassified Flavobacterium]|uniref:hypothetical protein n=3 Tax=Flavobacterium TaxID=237 RepID=UPI00131D590C|nr:MULTISPECIES: hypothetical protein [unclassified Flavobacterium]